MLAGVPIIMKRIYYVSRFSQRLSKRDLADIGKASMRNNPKERVTGFLVCLGDTFFQVLEGSAAAVDRLYYSRILQDPRHKDVLCLKSEVGVKKRMFPGWHMKAFDLNADAEILPFAFRQMLTALLESHHTLAQYTQPSLLTMLEHGVNPTTVRPRRTYVTVLYCDIIGFSQFSERLAPDDLIGLVNSQIGVCARLVRDHRGEVNKLTGDGLLAYFRGKTSDDAIGCATSILKEMRQRRSKADKGSPHRLLYSGVGLAHGLVYEGNVGFDLKRDFTILGNTVNLASRLESMTRELGVRLTVCPAVVRRAKQDWGFLSLGKHKVRGRSQPVEIFSLPTLPPLDVSRIYKQIQDFVGNQRK
jgi:class 3 adenylate cyclase